MDEAASVTLEVIWEVRLLATRLEAWLKVVDMASLEVYYDPRRWPAQCWRAVSRRQSSPVDLESVSPASVV